MGAGRAQASVDKDNQLLAQAMSTGEEFERLLRLAIEECHFDPSPEEMIGIKHGASKEIRAAIMQQGAGGKHAVSREEARRIVLKTLPWAIAQRRSMEAVKKHQKDTESMLPQLEDIDEKLSAKSAGMVLGERGQDEERMQVTAIPERGIVPAARLSAEDVKRILGRAGISRGRDVKDKQDHLCGMIESLPPDSDEIFKLITSSDQELKDYIAEALGMAPCSPEVESVFAAIIHSLPIREGATGLIRLQGVIYGSPVKIAEGGSGAIYRYTQEPPGDSTRPKTIILKTSPASEEMDADAARADMMSELKMHQRAQGGGGHPNIVRLMGPMRFPENRLGILLEDCSHGNVEPLFSDRSDREHPKSGAIERAGKQLLISGYTQMVVRVTLLRDLLEGLQHLHEVANMTHVDLKPRNLLIDNRGKVKVGDLGSAVTGIRTQISKRGLHTTEEYTTPEHAAASERKDPQRVVTPKGDAYVAGCMAIQLFSGTIPFVDDRELDVAHRSRVDFATSHGQGLELRGGTALDHLISRLTDPNPERRLTMSAALQSSVFSDPEVGSEEARQLVLLLADWHRATEKLEELRKRGVPPHQSAEDGVKIATPRARIKEQEGVIGNLESRIKALSAALAKLA
jgi:serine/threonine protein kinase